MYAAALPPPPLPQADQGSVNSRQQTTTKIAAEVIEVLHENSLFGNDQCSPRSHLFWPSSPQHDAQ